MNTLFFQYLSAGFVIASALVAGPVAFAATPQEALDAAIEEAQKTLEQIEFDGDAAAQRAKLVGLFARIAKCEVNLLRDIKQALLNFLKYADALKPLRELAAQTGTTASAREDFFREIAKRLFGPDGAIEKDMKKPNSLGLFSSLENTLAQDWYPNRQASDVIEKMLEPFWNEALADAVGKGESWAAAARQLALVRKLLAQMTNIRILHAKAYPPKSTPTTPGTEPTPPKVPSVLSSQTISLVLRALLEAASENLKFMTARRGVAIVQQVAGRAPETIDELKVECLKGARANLGFIFDGMQKFVDATPIECGNLVVRLFARSVASAGGEFRLAMRPVSKAVSSLANIIRVGLGAEFPKRVGRLAAAFNPEKLAQLSVAQPAAPPALAAVVSTGKNGGVALGKDTFDALNKELQNTIAQLDTQIKAKETELASASSAGARSVLEQELRFLRFQREITRNTKRVKDDIHECKIAGDGGKSAFDNFRKTIGDMIYETLKPSVDAVDSSSSAKSRAEALRANIAVWSDGGTAKLIKDGKRKEDVDGAGRGGEIETLMDAYNDALARMNLRGGLADLFLGRTGIMRELFDAIGVTDIFEQVGRVEEQLRAALVSKDEKNPSPAVRLSKNICDYDAVLTDLRCAVGQLPGVGEASKEVEERVTNYITNRDAGGDSPERIANDLLNKILDEAEAQARALVGQALADARVEDEMVPVLSAEDINVMLAAARVQAIADRNIQRASANSIQAFVRAFISGMKQLLRNTKDSSIDRAFTINSQNAEDIAAHDRAVLTLKREYDAKIDAQVDAAAKDAFAGLAEKLDKLISKMQEDFSQKRSDFQTMTELQEDAARLQAALGRSLQAVRERLAVLLSLKDEIDYLNVADKIREAYKTGGDTQEEKFAAVGKAIEEFFADGQKKAAPQQSNVPPPEWAKVKSE